MLSFFDRRRRRRGLAISLGFLNSRIAHESARCKAPIGRDATAARDIVDQQTCRRRMLRCDGCDACAPCDGVAAEPEQT